MTSECDSRITQFCILAQIIVIFACLSVAPLALCFEAVDTDSDRATSSDSSTSVIITQDESDFSSTDDSFSISSMSSYEDPYPTFYQWSAACKCLPFFKTHTEGKLPQIITYDNFEHILCTFIDSKDESSFSNRESWMNLSDASKTINNYFNGLNNSFQPYIEKKYITAGSTIAFKGDLHGDIHSLIAFIEHLNNSGYTDAHDPFRISDPNFYIVFLGDYTDKGIFGVEVLYTLLRLKIANQQQVFLVRGNHEDISLNATGGFYTELHQKFIEDFDPSLFQLKQKIAQMYSLLPASLFLGVQNHNYTYFLQCCHGGMELGHSPKNLLQHETAHLELLTSINRLTISKTCECLTDIPIDFTDIPLRESLQYADIGYMWSDFHTYDDHTISPSARGRHVYDYGAILTKELLAKSAGENFKICAVFRAHQHSLRWTSMMELILDRRGFCQGSKGCGKLWYNKHGNKNFWDGIVCTLMVSPDNCLGKGRLFMAYPQLTTDYTVFLQTTNDFEKWDLQIIANEIYNTKQTS